MTDISFWAPTATPVDSRRLAANASLNISDGAVQEQRGGLKEKSAHSEAALHKVTSAHILEGYTKEENEQKCFFINFVMLFT